MTLENEGFMQEAKKEALDRIIVKDNDRMQQIIDWYVANQDYLESQPFRMPFRQGLICLKGEDIELSFEAYSETDVLFKIYMVPDDKDVLICAFRYDPEKDIITEIRYPKNIPPSRLNIMKKILSADRTCQKEAFKYRVIMFYAAYYTNEIVMDKKQEKRLNKHTRKSLRKKGIGKIPLVRNTYVLSPEAESLKRPADPNRKRHYEKPDHEVQVKGYRRKNGTWVKPYSRYKDKGSGGPKIYKA